MNDFNDLPLLSIYCLVYNQAPYLRPCIDGFLSQKTNFHYEIIIHDDASTDGSTELLKKYKEEHPDKITLLLEEENQYSRVGFEGIERKICPFLRGKYIAFCEGDDFWIDSYKLQKQVDFLESHLDCSAVFGNFSVHDEISGYTNTLKFPKNRYGMFDVMSGLMPGLHNICMRKTAFDKETPLSLYGDMLINYKCALGGWFAYIDENFSVYRMTGHGVATSNTPGENREAAFKYRFLMHQELGFKHNRALAKFQSYLVLGDLFHNFNLDYLRTSMSLFRKYSVDDRAFDIWRIYYAFRYICVLFYYKVSGRDKIYLKI